MMAVYQVHTLLAGLVTTVLFCLHARPQIVEEDQPCTYHLSVWPAPNMRNVEMVRVHDMKFKETKHQEKQVLCYKSQFLPWRWMICRLF